MVQIQMREREGGREELKNVWSGIFKGYFDVEIQSYMGANF